MTRDVKFIEENRCTVKSADNTLPDLIKNNTIDVNDFGEKNFYELST